MSDIVDVLKAEANRLDRRAYADRCVGPDCALSSLVAATAAAEIERLRAEVTELLTVNDGNMEVSEMFRRERDSAEARLAEADLVIQRLNSGAELQAIMAAHNETIARLAEAVEWIRMVAGYALSAECTPSELAIADFLEAHDDHVRQARAFLAKLEGRSDAIRAMEKKP